MRILWYSYPTHQIQPNICHHNLILLILKQEMLSSFEGLSERSSPHPWSAEGWDRTWAAQHWIHLQQAALTFGSDPSSQWEVAFQKDQRASLRREYRLQDVYKNRSNILFSVLCLQTKAIQNVEKKEKTFSLAIRFSEPRSTNQVEN